MITETPTPETEGMRLGPGVISAVAALVVVALALTVIGFRLDGRTTGIEANVVEQSSAAVLASDAYEALRFRHGPFDVGDQSGPSPTSDPYDALRYRHE